MEISSHSEKLVSLEVLRITKLSAKSSLKETLKSYRIKIYKVDDATAAQTLIVDSGT